MATVTVNLQKALEKLAAMDGFVGAAVISPEGEVLASCKGDEWDMHATCSLAHNLFSASRKAARELAWGGVSQLDIATTAGTTAYLRQHVTPQMEVVLMLVCKQETSKALVRLRMDQTLPEITSALAA